MVKRARPKDQHFSMGARGPCIVMEDLGQTLRVQWIPSGKVTIENKSNCLPLRGNFRI